MVTRLWHWSFRNYVISCKLNTEDDFSVAVARPILPNYPKEHYIKRFKCLFFRFTYQRLMSKCTQTIIEKIRQFYKKDSKGSEQPKAVLHHTAYSPAKEPPIFIVEDQVAPIPLRIRLTWVSIEDVCDIRCTSVISYNTFICQTMLVTKQK